MDFIQENPYEYVVEPHPEKPDHEVYKLKLTKAIPDSIGDITGDMAQNLRQSLDHAAYAVAVASGKTDPKFTAFPFAGSVGQMANALGRSKDVPPQIQSLFCGFLPYPGGNDLLWALNEIAVGDKHKIAVPIGQGAFRAGAAVRGTGFFRMPDPHVWDRTKNEMEVITLGPGAEFNYNFDFRLFVAFNEVKLVDGQPILTIMQKIGQIVDRVLTAIEAEARRLKIVT